MKITNLSGKERLAYVRELYEAALSASSETVARLEKNLSQYLGTDEIDGSSERALTVRNITFELIESEVSPDVPSPKVDADFYTEHRERNARSIERLCGSLKGKLPIESINDSDERNTYVFGASVFYVEWDNAEGGVRIHTLSPLSFVPQPGIPDTADMEYCFLCFSTPRGELSSKYKVKREDLSLAQTEYEYGADGLSDTVSLVVCFYRSETGEIGKFVFSGELILEDLPSYYRRKISLCSKCGSIYGSCSCKDSEPVKDDLIYESVCTEGGEIALPYYLPRRFPIVVRKNSFSDGSLYGVSDCEVIRPQQQAINKIESRILKKLLRAAVTPVIPEGSSVTPNNSVFGEVIKMRPGESLDCYGKIDTTPDISEDIKEADRLYDHAKRVLGISDAYLGRESHVGESGYSLHLRISQSSGRLESKRRLKRLAYAELYKLVFEHYLAFSDEVRPLSYKDSHGKVHDSVFSRYDFIEQMPFPHYDDEYIFTSDTELAAEYERDALWQKNLSNLKEGTLGDKENPETLLRYWQAQERAHYPGAREMVEYFKDIIKAKEGEKKNER